MIRFLIHIIECIGNCYALLLTLVGSKENRINAFLNTVLLKRFIWCCSSWKWFWNMFLGCSGSIRVWELDLPNRKIRPTECQTGQLKRLGTCAMVSCLLTCHLKNKGKLSFRPKRAICSASYHGKHKIFILEVPLYEMALNLYPYHSTEKLQWISDVLVQSYSVITVRGVIYALNLFLLHSSPDDRWWQLLLYRHIHWWCPETQYKKHTDEWLWPNKREVQPGKWQLYSVSC